jgi:trigger factor
MKSELVELSETRKQLVVEIPREVVDAAIDRMARDYSRAVRLPGFRPGKAPPRLVRQRYRDQILHEVAHDLIARAVDEALRERGLEPVESPDIRDVVVAEGQPLKFTAAFETIPPIDPGDYSALTLRRPPVELAPEAVERALARLQHQAARYEPVEGRGAEEGDTVLANVTRRVLEAPGLADPAAGRAETHEQVAIDVGAPANPPGLDRELLGLRPGDRKRFVVTYPADHAVAALAGAQVEYEVEVTSLKRRVLPDLDDEFARDVGAFESLAALKASVEADLRAEAEREADRQVRDELLRLLASRVTVEVPEALVAREVDRRLEEVVRRLLEQGIDPSRVEIDWEALRARQQESAREAVKRALVLDAIARREGVTVSDAEVEEEVARYAARAGRTVAAVRAALEANGGLARLRAGLRREKVIDLLLTRARIVRA